MPPVSSTRPTFSAPLMVNVVPSTNFPTTSESGLPMIVAVLAGESPLG